MDKGNDTNTHNNWCIDLCQNRRKTSDGCPCLIDIQFSTRQTSNSDRVVTLRNTAQVDTLNETDRHAYVHTSLKFLFLLGCQRHPCIVISFR